MDSFDLGGETADGIVRTDCWRDGGNANGSYGLVRIGTDSIVRVTFLWDSVHTNGSF